MKTKLLPLLMLLTPFFGVGQNCKSVKKTVDDMTNTTTFHGKTIFNPSIAGLISEIEFVRVGSTYEIIYSHVYWEPKRVSVDTTQKFIVKLNNGDLLTLTPFKRSVGKESEDFLTKRTFTTISVPMIVTEDQVKQMGAIGIEKVRLTIDQEESVDDKTNRITNKDVMQLATCITQVN
jgi:hypothetical protein